MDTTTVQTVSAVLDEFAVRFGATGAHLWEEMVRYQVASAIADVIVFPMITAIAFGVFSWARKKAGEEDYAEGWVVLSVSVGVISGVLAIISTVAIAALIPTLVAPEAATLKSLIP